MRAPLLAGPLGAGGRAHAMTIASMCLSFRPMVLLHGSERGPSRRPPKSPMSSMITATTAKR